MRKMGLMGLAVIMSSMLLCGCSATELEDRCFPMMAVADYQEGQVAFAYGFPELSQKDDTDLAEAKVNAPITREISFAKSVEAYDRELSKLADCNHLKVLVLGENLMDQPQYEEMLAYLKETELFPRNTYVCVTKDVSALFEIEEKLPEDVGTYLETYLQNHEQEQQIRLLNLGKLIDEQENKSEKLALPYIAIEDEAIIWDGYYYIEKND